LGAIGRGTKNSGGLANGAENYSAAKVIKPDRIVAKLKYLMVLLKLRSGKQRQIAKGSSSSAVSLQNSRAARNLHRHAKFGR